mmetsp:Transcript_2890/g.7014  ORF Transcript_2890/g.7014 Transcript_2890/m.7014 type:complete len:278 (+) Transcript_2890:40-873(+)
MARGAGRSGGSAYEQQRQERVCRNAEVLKNLEVGQIVATLNKRNVDRTNAERGIGIGTFPRRRRCRANGGRRKVPERKSPRLRGEKPGKESVVDVLDEPEKTELLDLEEYFKLNDIDIKDAIRTEGQFNGWLSEDIRSRYGIARNATQAWEENGGGKFKYKISKADVPTHLRSKGWSNARAFSSTLMLKNPNAFFYRHVAPHESQRQGEWTEEEHNLFLETARKYGVGDKWGLFASYVPQRVGYQCSAYYRDEMVSKGLILDTRFRMTRGGRAVFVG